MMFVPACKEEPGTSEKTLAHATPAAPDFTTAFKHAVRWDSGKSALVVDVSIAPGFHAYTTGETTGKPLLVEILADSDMVANGEVEYPKGVEKDLPIGKSVIVEGKAAITAPVKAKDAASASKKAKGTLRYQVCTEKTCDRPRTAPFEVDTAS